MIVQYSVPRRLKAADVLSFIKTLQPVAGATRYEFDFSAMGRTDPFGMLVLASALRRFRKSLPHTDFGALHYQGKSYHAWMGLFRAFGLDFGGGEAHGSNTYLPITRLEREQIRALARESTQGFNETLEGEARKLARLLLQVQKGPSVEMLTYSLREIMRNVFEHAECDELSYCGQYWPTLGLVEVAISDDGIGIRRGLASNPYVDPESDYEALKTALLPGISGKAFEGRRVPRNDDWANSGYGLFMTSSLSRTAGQFVIASGGAALIAEGESHRQMETAYSGTAIPIQLKVGNDMNFDSVLMELRDKGGEIARDLRGAVITPSAASAMLKRPLLSSRRGT